MLKLKKARIYDCSRINRLRNKLKNDLIFAQGMNFYDVFNGNLLMKILSGNAYIIAKEQSIKGYLVHDHTNKRIYVMPEEHDLDIFKVFELAVQLMPCTGTTMLLKYRDMDIQSIRNKFGLEIHDNLMYMKCEKKNMNKAIQDNSILLVRKLVVTKEEHLRIDLQNRIFGNIRNRTPLTLSDILYEESSSKFLKNFCFVLEEYRVPAGYGQILKFGKEHYLVNFGIIDDFRKKGYGCYFLYHIMKSFFFEGTANTLYLSVDRMNDAAIGLYRKMGFEETHNTVTFELP